MIFSFFHIWLASVEFGREKSITWHVAFNFQTLKLSVKSKYEIAICCCCCLFTSPNEQAEMPSHVPIGQVLTEL